MTSNAGGVSNGAAYSRYQYVVPAPKVAFSVRLPKSIQAPLASPEPDHALHAPQCQT
jgi:hypothetical protein